MWGLAVKSVNTLTDTERCPLSLCWIRPLQQTHCGSDNNIWISAAHSSQSWSQCASHVLLIWRAFKLAHPWIHKPTQSCNKPKLHSGHHCTTNSCATCSDWSGNSHLGICFSSQPMDGTCICGESGPLGGLCSTRAWISEPWHLPMESRL